MMVQMLNLGLLSVQLFVLIAVVNSIEMPAAMFAGIVSYRKAVPINR